MTKHGDVELSFRPLFRKRFTRGIQKELSMILKSFGFSDPGRHRHRNEDRYLCDEIEGLFLVADGMGGRSSGDKASQLAVESVQEFVIRSRSEDMEWPVKKRKSLSLEQNRLLAAFFYANNRIYELSARHPSMRGMGTTLVGALVDGKHLAIANVGDSRLYRVREDKITQITRDHSVVGEKQRKGLLSDEEARRHPERHLLTRALGVETRPTVDLFAHDIKPGDLFLLCSDGLYGTISDEAILNIIKSHEQEALYKIGMSLVLKASLEDAMDDITVVLILFH